MSIALIIFLVALVVAIASAGRGEQLELHSKRLLEDHNALIAAHHVASDAVVDLLHDARDIEKRISAHAGLTAWALVTLVISGITVLVQVIR